MSRGLGAIQKKALLLLETGIALGFSRAPLASLRIVASARKEWKGIERNALRRAIRALYASRLVEGREHPDGTTTLVLSENGKRRTLAFRIDEMKIKKPTAWDRRWRVVIFDIPEKRKNVRDALRGHLRQIGFYELQKSVFVHPYPCGDEIEFLVEFHQVRAHVRRLTVHAIDNDLHLRRRFHL